MAIIFQANISREDLKANPYVYYIFGDNDLREGYGGQAYSMRGEPNAIGIRTKKAPGNLDRDFYNDDELQQNLKKIHADIETVRGILDSGTLVVIPLLGIGTGRSALRSRAPNTFSGLKLYLAMLTKNLAQEKIIMDWT
jgi:hypothetical protein